MISLYSVEFNPLVQASQKAFDLLNQQSYVRFLKLNFKGKVIAGRENASNWQIRGAWLANAYGRCSSSSLLT